MSRYAQISSFQSNSFDFKTTEAGASAERCSALRYGEQRRVEKKHVYDDAGGTINYIYNAAGQPITISTNGSATRIEYDRCGNQIALHDPDAGTIRYYYYADNQLQSQVTAKGDSTVMIYDTFGRLHTKQLYDRTNNTITETINTYVSDGNGIGQIESIEQKVNGQTTHYQQFSYNKLHLLETTTDDYDNRRFRFQTQYDDLWRPQYTTSPSGLTLETVYDRYGDVKQVKSESKVIWAREEQTGKGQIKAFSLGNGLITRKSYLSNGLLSAITTGTNNSPTSVLHFNYDYDGSTYSLIDRNDRKNNRRERFRYDNLDRLTHAFLNSQLQYQMDYHPNGNIETKSDVGEYEYNLPQPHAMSGIAGDAGEGVSDEVQYIAYTAFNKVSLVEQNNDKYLIYYELDEQRIKTEYYYADELKSTRYYFGNYELEIDSLGRETQVDYVYSPSGLIAIQKNSTLYYVHTDNMGSIQVITDEHRQIVSEYAYTPWGGRILLAGKNITDRGYTGHEHLVALGLINMNGRIYDPVLARFLSPDPYVQAPTFTQSFNRYTYCLNNPFLYTDPSGENPLLIALGIYCLFFTDFGYDIQKAVSPVAVKIDLRFGSNQGGIGIDASIGVPQMFPISYRVHGGATYFWKNEDLMGNHVSGWETRYGGEWGISFGTAFQVKYGGTTFNSKWSGKQTTNLFTLGNPLINVKYENDMDLEFNMPGIPRGDGDRYRTAAAQINFGSFGIGTNIITGDAGDDRWENGHWEYIDGHKTYIANDGYNPNSHRMGTFYFKAGPFRLGWNSEGNRKVFQNQFAHDFLTGGQSYWFEVLNLKPKWYWQFGYSGGGTLW